MSPDLDKIEKSSIYNFLIEKVYLGEWVDGSERIAKFLQVIIQMLADDYHKRITLEEALERVQKIKATKIAA